MGVLDAKSQDAIAKQVIADFILEYVDEQLKDGAFEVILDDIFIAAEVNGKLIWNRKGYPSSLGQVVEHIYKKEKE